MPYARKILDNVALSYQIIEEYQKGNQGSIFIGFIKSLDDELLLKLLQKIKDHFPHIDLHYKAYSRKELLTLFKERQLDAIITFEYPEVKDYSHLLLQISHLRKYYHHLIL